jgi:hypothetical protein
MGIMPIAEVLTPIDFEDQTAKYYEQQNIKY